MCKVFVAFLNIYCQVKWRLGEYFEAFLENGFLRETRFLVINVNFCGSTLEKLALVELKLLAVNPSGEYHEFFPVGDYSCC